MGEILADPDAFLRQDMHLQGKLNAELGGGEFMFDDGTGQINPTGRRPSKVITYTAPQTSEARDIKGKVALLVGEFAPIASYSTTVEPLR